MVVALTSFTGNEISQCVEISGHGQLAAHALARVTGVVPGEGVGAQVVALIHHVLEGVRAFWGVFWQVWRGKRKGIHENVILF